MMVKSSRMWAWLVMCAVVACALLPVSTCAEEQLDTGRFSEHVRALTSTKHRVSGTREGKAARDYIVEQLRALSDDVLLQSFSFPQEIVDECEFRSDTSVVPLLPFSANGMQPAVTPGDGLSGDVIYLGRLRIGVNDILDWSGLIRQIVTQANSDDPSPGRQLRTLLNAKLMRELAKAADGGEIDESLQNKLVDALNQDVLSHDTLYAPEAWKGTEIDERTRFLIKKKTFGAALYELIELNRSLLAAAYPGAIAVGAEGRDLTGCIAVMDYDNCDDFARAFQLGAKAVVFVRWNGDTVRRSGLGRTGVSANMPRFYLSESDAQACKLLTSRRGTVVSRVRWEKQTGHNVFLFVCGTRPVFKFDKDEFVILSAHYDTDGVVPRNSSDLGPAANCAALLETARHLVDRPGRRSVLIAFFDNQANFLQGGRRFYAALRRGIPERIDDPLPVRTEYLAAEKTYVNEMINVLATEDILTGNYRLKKRVLGRLAEYAKSEYNAYMRKLSDVRNAAHLLKGRAEAAAVEDEIVELRDLEADLLERKAGWQVVRECIRDEQPIPAKQEKANAFFEEVCNGVVEQKKMRLVQIDAESQTLAEETSLITLLDGANPICHVGFSFSEGGSRWLLIPHLLVEHGRRYGELLDKAAEKMKEDSDNGFVWESRETWNSANAKPQDYVVAPEDDESAFAAVFGIPAMSLVTELDPRLSARKPDVQIDASARDRILAQASGFFPILRRLLDDPCMSVPNAMPRHNNFIIEEPIWRGGRPVGHSVRSFDYGDTVANKDEPNALVHIFPGSGDKFDRDYYVYANANGHIPLVPISKKHWSNIQMEACRFDTDGVISAISTVIPGGGIAAVDPAWHLAGRWRPKVACGYYSQLAVFEGTIGTFVGRGRPLAGPFRYNRFKLLDGSSNSEFKLQHLRYDTRTGVGLYQVERPHGIKIIYEDAKDAYDVLLYLNATGTGEKQWIGYGPGNGQYDADGPLMLPLNQAMAEDIFTLNESRLVKLRSKNIYLDFVEYLHSKTKFLIGLRQTAMAENDHKSVAMHSAVIAATESRVYRPVMATTDDMVNAVTILLLLAIPFACSLQSLLLPSYNIYRRIGGFAIFFAISFAILCYTHPAFAFSATPTVIILAFIIMLMSGTVIWVVGSKFSYEIKKLQGLVAAAHTFEKSVVGNVSAAASLAISIMKRRPARTILTITTVLLLTFTILSFVAFQTEKKVNAFYMGPAHDQVSRLLIRERAWKTVRSSVQSWRDYVDTYHRGNIDLHGRYWLVPDLTVDDSSSECFIPIRHSAGTRAVAGSIMTISELELARIPEIRSVLPPGNLDKLAAGVGVCLSKSIANALQASVGDMVSFRGRTFEFLGVFDSKRILDIQQIDGSPFLPVNFQGTRASMGALGATGSAAGGADPQEDLERELALLEPEALDPVDPEALIVIGPAAARDLGLQLKSVVMYPAGPEASLDKLCQELPILNQEGIYVNEGGERTRYFYGDRYDVSGPSAVVLPLILGGLIIFSTMLGSIIDREKEIYTFSALGLAPRSIAMLFFVEAGIYAVIGGFGGYLCSQVVARLLDVFAKYGIFEAPEMNYSSSTVINTILLVMATVLVSTIYPAFKAAGKATAQTTGHWTLPPAENDRLEFDFPFTISQYDITGIMCFLREHFMNHADRTVGEFAADRVDVFREPEQNFAALKTRIWLQPFDQGISQSFTVTARKSDIPEVCEIHVALERLSGPASAWKRSYRLFLNNLRSQFLLWRTLDDDSREHYLTLADKEDVELKI